MSKCVVHMQKMKMGAMGGIQSHNQREHESKKNKEIDYEKSQFNFDTVNAENINYQRTVKERIAELNLKKAVRKDAVVYCSFIVSSDREFFRQLGEQIHLERCDDERDRNWWDSGYTQNYDSMELYSEEYQTECIRIGAESFFQYATQFFKERYGKENVLNGTVHMDEATPHMHLGIVPVTSDGRLSAKDIFTPLELKQLQTDFAEKVGAKYGLERGKEGSQAKHLDEVTFKLKKRQEELDIKQGELFNRNLEVSRLEKTSERLKSEISALEMDKTTLEREIEPLKGKIKALEDKLEKLQTEPQVLMEEFVQNPSVKVAFDNYCLTVRRRQQQERAEREKGRKMSLSYWREQVEKRMSSLPKDKSDTLQKNNDLER